MISQTDDQTIVQFIPTRVTVQDVQSMLGYKELRNCLAARKFLKKHNILPHGNGSGQRYDLKRIIEAMQKEEAELHGEEFTNSNPLTQILEKLSRIEKKLNRINN